MRFADLHPNIKIRILTGFLQKLSQALVFQFMAVYFSDHFGLQTAGVILLLTVFLSFLSSLYGGYYADQLGRRPVLLVSESVRWGVLCLTVLVNSSWLVSPAWTALLFGANAVLMGIAAPANEAMVVDVSSGVSRKFVYSFNYWASNLALAAGSMLGAYFYHGSLFWLLCFTALSSAVTVALIAVFVQETKAPDPLAAAIKFSILKILASYRAVVQDTLFLRYLIAGILILSFEYQMSYFITVRLTQEFPVQPLFAFGWFDFRVDGLQMVGILRLINTVLVVMLATAMQRLAANRSDRRVIFVGCVLLAAGTAVSAVSNDGWVLIAASVVLTLGELLYVPVHQSILASIAKDHQIGQYMAVNTLRTRGANLIGSLGAITGALVPSWTMAVGFLALGAVCLVLYHGILQSLMATRPGSGPTAPKG